MNNLDLILRNPMSKIQERLAYLIRKRGIGLFWAKKDNLYFLDFQ